jgi:hypothetical protein
MSIERRRRVWVKVRSLVGLIGFRFSLNSEQIADIATCWTSRDAPKPPSSALLLSAELSNSTVVISLRATLYWSYDAFLRTVSIADRKRRRTLTLQAGEIRFVQQRRCSHFHRHDGRGR